MSQSITILIVDHQEIVRYGVRLFLEGQSHFEVIGEADCGNDALKIAAHCAPQVVIMEMMFPDLTGIDVIHGIKKICPTTQIVVLTSVSEWGSCLDAFKAGAISYLLKDIKLESLREVILTAVRGEADLHPWTAACILQYRIAERWAHESGTSDLSCRELDVLKLVAIGMTNPNIAEKLGIVESTVKQHVSKSAWLLSDGVSSTTPVLGFHKQVSFSSRFLAR